MLASVVHRLAHSSQFKCLLKLFVTSQVIGNVTAAVAGLSDYQDTTLMILNNVVAVTTAAAAAASKQ